ncbi:hypothetical protein [Dyadobacter frigoris]|uniref:T9SS type A sorting domain-containing protein n=1 Tax=Dyadobacter frigoris TaxID=2576211 RepID=A0A4U6D1H7_9BACT|nr:hypothetical protein [Dyadobacter frigoris]TKT90446.1 hypothetical protein FDK13_19090 [Dyadobacter frigoris]GLU51428.1 hypothetical protein Dfri01_08890 [Dyadobacter frigoris]
MKISNTLILPCVLALALSLSSFTSGTSDKKEHPQKEETTKKAFDAYLVKVPNTNKVKLLVDRNVDARLRILLTGKDGKVYYSETNDDKQSKYRRQFDMNDLTDGVYYFELYSKKQTLIKEIRIQSASEKLVSLL